MNEYYKVAGFTFGISVPEDFPIVDKLGNYAPFEQNEADAGNLLFLCSICNALPDGEKEVYYLDNPKEKDMPGINIFRQAGGYLFEMRAFADSTDIYRLWTDADFSKGKLLRWDLQKSGRFPLDNALMLMFAFSTVHRSTLEMHASVTVNNGVGYLFLGVSGTGKSTHSRMWLENIPGSMLLNDDNPVVRIMPNGQVRVFGTPWSGKTPCYVNLDFPVQGFVQIVQFPENLIERQGNFEAYVSLYSSCSGMNLNSDITDVLHKTIENIIGSVPCWQLKCLPDGNAARVCYECVKNGDISTAE